MDSDFGVLFLLGSQLVLLQLCESQTTVCSNGDVRLVNGTGPYEGRVEICHSGVWKTVCDDYWSNSHARIVCTQLNYPPQDSLALHRAPFGQGNGSILERIYCRGSELKLIDCTVTDYPDNIICYHSEDAGVRCLSCNTHGAVRLRGSSLQYRGRVEICVNGVWGTVCDDYWDIFDAGVVCRQLGHSRFGSRGYSGAPYGPGRGPIHLDNVRCRGSEQSLIDCPYTNNTFGRDCTHGMDAAIYCQPTLQCEEGDLRLTWGSTENQGTVEICVNETWGTICFNNWGQSEATATCRQLGFSGHGIRELKPLQEYDVSQCNNLSCRNILCTGRELWLMDCQRDSSTGYCYIIAGVQCSFDYLASPPRFQMTFEESNLYTLSWQRPPIYSRGHGNILNYFINCSIMHKDGRRNEWTFVTRNSTYVTLRFQPHQYYNCCVAAVNEAGRGNSSCQAFITHEADPTAAPTNIQAHQLIDDSTSVFLSWRPPLAQHQNGIIRGYYVELNSTDGVEFQYTTQDQHLLIDNLQPFAVYTCRVAAYTTGSGPFSKPLTIILNSDNGEETQIESSQGSATVSVATLSTLLVVVVIMVGVCFAVQISYKVAIRKKSAPVHNDIECKTVEDPKPSKPETTLKESSKLSHTRTAKQNKHDYRDGSLTPPLPPRTYSLSSSLDKIDNLENRQPQGLSSDQELKDQNPQSESTYQPLILPQHTATTGSEYQSLTQLRQCEMKL